MSRPPWYQKSLPCLSLRYFSEFICIKIQSLICISPARIPRQCVVKAFQCLAFNSALLPLEGYSFYFPFPNHPRRSTGAQNAIRNKKSILICIRISFGSDWVPGWLTDWRTSLGFPCASFGPNRVRSIVGAFLQIDAIVGLLCCFEFWFKGLLLLLPLPFEGRYGFDCWWGSGFMTVGDLKVPVLMGSNFKLRRTRRKGSFRFRIGEF